MAIVAILEWGAFTSVQIAGELDEPVEVTRIKLRRLAQAGTVEHMGRTPTDARVPLWGLSPSTTEGRRLRELEHENHRLRELLAIEINRRKAHV